MAIIKWKTKEEIEIEKIQSLYYEKENFYNLERQRGLELITEQSLDMDYVSENDVLEIKLYLKYINPKTKFPSSHIRPKIMDDIYPLIQ